MSLQTGQWTQKNRQTRVIGNSIHMGNARMLGALLTQHQKKGVRFAKSFLRALLHTTVNKRTAVVYWTHHAPYECHICIPHHYILNINRRWLFLVIPILQMRKMKPQRWHSWSNVTLATGFKALVSYCSLELEPGFSCWGSPCPSSATVSLAWPWAKLPSHL